MSEEALSGGEAGEARARTKAPRWTGFLGPGILLILVLGMYHDVLFSNGARILSAQQQDLTSQFVPWREWGFGLLRQGHVALWNPHTFCGMPFVGMLQSALFYPPNVLYLFLPIGVATNWGLALHVYLAGVLMYAWARRRTVGPIGATVSGVTYMLCAPYIMHMLPGHVPFLAVAAWTPLVFLVADALIDSPTMGWVLLGMFAVTMQILAGYPQPAYIAAVAGSLYLVLNLVGRIAWEYFTKYRDDELGPTKERWIGTIKALVAWGAIYVGAALLSAAQLGAAVATTAESGRGGGKAPFDFASSFPVPLSNAVAMFVPNFWGDKVHSPYYGEWFIWEIIPYYGAVGLMLALYALVAWDKRRRFAWTVVAVLMVLALGRQTPVYRVMYDYFPMFGKFRGAGKFAYGAAPFIALLAGMGWECLRAAPRKGVIFAIAALIGSGTALYWSHEYLETAPYGMSGEWGKVLIAADACSDPTILMNSQKEIEINEQRRQALKDAGKLDAQTDDEIENRIKSLESEKQSYVGYRQFDARLFLPDNIGGKLGPAMHLAGDVAARDSAEFVAGQLKFAGIIWGCFGLLLLATMLDQRVAGLIAVLVVVEMVAYEMGVHITTPTHPEIPAVWLSKAEEIKGDRAFALDSDMFNAGMIYGIDNIWGYDPVVLKRTVQFIAYSQGMTDPKALDELVDQPPIHTLPPYAFTLLRYRYLFARAPQVVAIPAQALPMKRLNLVGAAVTQKGRDSVLKTVFDSAFNPRGTVVLEEAPNPAPEGDRGFAEVVKEDSDSVEISADVPQATVLLVTDAYSDGWIARELDGDEQHAYKVLPADWMLRAIPLSKGHHHFLMEYSPKEWRVGKAVSLVTVPIYLIYAGRMLVRRRKLSTNEHELESRARRPRHG
jgi:hypothetical protein